MDCNDKDINPNQIPHDYGTEDMWGWQDWQIQRSKVREKNPHPKATNLYPQTHIRTYFRGCSSCGRPRKM